MAFAQFAGGAAAANCFAREPLAFLGPDFGAGGQRESTKSICLRIRSLGTPFLIIWCCLGIVIFLFILLLLIYLLQLDSGMLK